MVQISIYLVKEKLIFMEVTLDELNSKLIKIAEENGCSLDALQSNAEHELINAIHEASNSGIDVILINPAAYTHTSIALRDALLGVKIPFFEIHISDIFSREEFRHKSFFSDIAENIFSGMGIDGYEKALMEAISKFKRL